MLKSPLFRALFFCLLLLPKAGAANFNHSRWNTLLDAHVTNTDDGHASVVDYSAMAKNRSALQSYLNALSDVSRATFDSWTKDVQLAFLINAYNAWTVEFILSKWPQIESIKELGSFFKSPWKKTFIPLLGKTRSLDDIEHNLIRGSGAYEDPRIHFAVNCASVGCPALRTEAYTGAQLDQQLSEQTQRFLSDRSRNRVNGDTLELSSIFKWYREDFEKGWLGYQSLSEFLFAHADALNIDAAMGEKLAKKQVDIDFLPYDWALNKP